jgi:hypothetical protein
MAVYSLEARIIQKKDQIEERSATGAIIPAPMVEEVRTGQQFLIKIHLSKNNTTNTPSKFPALRVRRREAINTGGEARSEPEPLTLEIAVHLAKSGQTRKGACAKCCHKVRTTHPLYAFSAPFICPTPDQPLFHLRFPRSFSSITFPTLHFTFALSHLCSRTPPNPCTLSRMSMRHIHTYAQHRHQSLDGIHFMFRAKNDSETSSPLHAFT